MWKRITYTTVTFITFFILPWWVALALSVIGMVLFRAYIEGLLFFILYDILFFAPEVATPIPYLLVVSGLVLYLGIGILKRYLALKSYA